MAALAPGDPKLVSMIVNHLKNQGLFDQFRRDCLADVDTKPAYQNLRQRVDNFVSNHLASHTWSPHLNKNQLRNSLRQMVLQSGMLEVGVDRIISQVVDPKINHIFRPQVEKAVHEFLATVDRKEEPTPVNNAQNSEKQEPTTPGPSSNCPNTSKANDALSILDTITSLNQEASAARSTVENSSGKNCEKNSKKISTTEIKSQSFDHGMEKDHITEETEKFGLDAKVDDGKFYSKSEGSINALTSLKDFEDKLEKAETIVESIVEKSDKIDKREKDVIRNEQLWLSKNERRGKRKDCESMRHISATLTVKQTAKENLKKEYFLDDSDFEGLSDITVSSVHTSDLSSFEEEEDDEEEEGEVSTSDSSDEIQEQSSEEKDINLETIEEEHKEGKAKPGRHPYVHKPFLYSKYHNDSDDEETVVQRRQSIAKEKAERLLRRQWNRERIEDKHKQLEIEKDKPPQETLRDEENLQTLEKGINSNVSVETNSRKMQPPTTLITKVSKAALKEQKILEKKVALRRKRKGDLRTLSGKISLHHEDRKRKRELPEEFKETQIKTEFIFQNKEKIFASSTSKDPKNAQISDQSLGSVRILSEFNQSNGESNNHLKIDHKICQKQPRNNDSVMDDLETSGVHKLDDFRLEENLKDSSKHKDEMKHVKHSAELLVSESDIRIDAEQKRGTSEEITNCYQVILSSDSKTLLSSTDSAELSIIEYGQDGKSRDHLKLKEEKGNEKGKEKKYVIEGSWPKSRENTQEDAKGHEKHKEKRNESECTRPKFKENSQNDVKSSEKWKEKRNDSENPSSKFKESTYEDAKSREMKNEPERGRTKSRENTLDEKGHEKSKDKKYMPERARLLSKEGLQEDVKGSEKGKERRGESGNSRSKSKEKIHDDIRSQEKVKENQNESENTRSKSRETVQEDVRSKEKRKNFENSRSRSKEELQEDKSREKRIEKRRESESSWSKSKERVDSSRSKTKESIELSRSKSKEDDEYNQKGMEKRHDSETARLKLKEHSEITRSKSREKLQGEAQNERVEKRRDSENTRSKSKDNIDNSRSKSREKMRDSVQNEKGMEKKHYSENTGPKPKEYSESSHSRVKEKVRDSAQGTVKGVDKRHDSKIRHFEKSRSRSKEDLQEDNVKKMERKYDFGSIRSKSGEHIEHSRSKSKEHSESSRTKHKDRVQENIQNNEKGMDRKHKYENTLSKSLEYSEKSQSKCSEKGKENIKDCEKGKLKNNDFQNILSKSMEFFENVEGKSKERKQSDDKGLEKGDFETLQPCSKDKMQDLHGNEKLEEKEIRSPAAVTKPKTASHEDEQSREKSNKLKNVAKYEEPMGIAKSNEMEERNKVENDQSGSKVHLQKDIKSKEIVKVKNDIENLELGEWHLDENKISDTKEKSENTQSKSNEGQNDQTNEKKGTDTENLQLNSKESIPDTKEVAHNTPGNLVEIENLIKFEDKIEERTETFESERNEAGPMKDINMGEKELETVQSKTGECKAFLFHKEQTEKPTHDQLARPNEINILLDMEQHGSLHTPYKAISSDTPTMNDTRLLHPIADKAQFVHYDPSSPATPTLDENFSYEAPSIAPDSVVPSVEVSGKQEAHNSETVAEELCDKHQIEEMDTKCELSKVESQELPVQQDVVSEINTSAICECKDEDVIGESVKGAEEQSSTRRERKPKRPYTPVENPSKRRHLHSEEKCAVADEPVEAVLVQVQDEERPTQSRGKTTSKVEEKARNQTNDVSSQNKPTTRAAKKVSSPEHLSVTERDRRSLTSAKEKLTTDSKAGKSPAPVSVTRSRNQPSPVTKQGRKREASPERKRRQQQKTEVPPKRTRR